MKKLFKFLFGRKIYKHELSHAEKVNQFFLTHPNADGFIEIKGELREFEIKSMGEFIMNGHRLGDLLTKTTPN